MLCVMVTGDGLYRVEYRLEGTLCAVLECAELTTALEEVERKMRLEMGLAKGLTFLTKTGREI